MTSASNITEQLTRDLAVLAAGVALLPLEQLVVIIAPRHAVLENGGASDDDGIGKARASAKVLVPGTAIASVGEVCRKARARRSA